MAASINDKFTEATGSSRPVPTTLSALLPSGSSPGTASCNALTGWPTATAVHFIIYNVDVNGSKVANSQTDWKGIVSGSTITGLVLKAGTNSGYSVGAVVQASPTAAWADDVVEGISVSLNQDGTMKESAVRSALSLGEASASGWELEGETVDSVVNNGNGSYTMTFNSADLSGRLSPGMRIRTTRDTEAPDQCADLEASSSQYFSKSSPTGITFTDDFTVMGWVNLESYSGDAIGRTIASRFSGSGWILRIIENGQIEIFGDNSGGGADQYVSNQSIPLGKWVHIAASMDMSGSTGSIYINGVEVTGSYSNGTSTSITQSGDLEVGSYNGGASGLFDGKLAQVAIFDAILSEANIREYMSRPLTGSETNCVAAFSLDNDITDLTANNNDLTAGGSAVATDTDSPFGNGGVSTTLDYGVVESVTYSTNTDVDVITYSGNTIDATNTISAVSYSTSDVPYGLPTDPQNISANNNDSGIKDTGWINGNDSGLSWSSEFDADKDDFWFRRIGNVVHVEGFARKDSGNVDSNDDFVILPEGFRSSRVEYFVGMGAGISLNKCAINVSGLIESVGTPTASTTYQLIPPTSYVTDEPFPESYL